MPEPYVPKEEDEDESLGDVADADLVAAAEAALKGVDPPDPKPAKAKVEAPKEEEPERDEHGRFLKRDAAPQKPKPKEEAEAEKPSSVIARELAKREEARAEKTKLAEVEKAWERIQQIEEKLKSEAAELAKERQAIAEARKDPAAFLAQNRWTADQFIDLATRAKDPVYQESVALREELSKRDAIIEELKAGVAELRAKADGYDKQTAQSQVQAEVNEFLGSIPKDSPVWKDYEDREDLLYFAKKTRQRYYERTGKVASPKELGEYLHYKALQRRAESPAEPAGGKPIAGKSKAKVPRALGGTESSERRPGSGAKHVHDMTPAEEREYLARVAEEAVLGTSD